MEEIPSRRSLIGAASVTTGVAAAALAALPAPALAQGAPQSGWEAIRARGSIRMGVANAEPWAFKDPASGQFSGFSIMFGRALAEALGVRLDIEELTLATMIAAMQANRIDFCPVLDGTPARALAVDFTLSPLVWHAQAVLIRDDMNARTWEDLNQANVTIAVPQGSVMETNVRRFMPRATVLSFPNNPETIAAFQSGRANAASLFAPALTVLHARLRRGKIVIPTPTRVAVSQVAVRREADKTLRDWLDICTAFYYNTNQTQVWYEEFLRTRNVDPANVPAIRRELWPT